MHNFFSLRRFGALFSTYIGENAKKLGLQIFALFACLLIMFLLFASFDDYNISEGMQIGIFYIGLYFGCFLFTASSFMPYAKGSEASYQLLVPASSFEKTLLHWLTTTICFLIIYVICYHLCRLLTISIITMWQPGINQSYYDLIPKSMNDESQQIIFIFSLFYILIHSLTFLGSITFPKYTILLTLFMIVVILTVLIGWQIYWYKATPFLNQSSGFLGLPFTDIEAYTMDNPSKAVRIQFPLNPWLGIASLAIVQLLITASTYFKLKEKQV